MYIFFIIFQIQQLYQTDQQSESTVNSCFLNLSSVQNLRQLVIENTCTDLRLLVRSHVFIGCVDAGRVLVQHSTGLFMIDVERFTEELFYQVMGVL